MSSRVIRINDWVKFKHLLIKYDARVLAYNIEMGVPARYLTTLRLILPTSDAQYIFIDTASGNRLRRTGIPLHMDKMGNIYIKDEDVINFVRSELGKKDVRLHPYWSM